MRAIRPAFDATPATPHHVLSLLLAAAGQRLLVVQQTDAWLVALSPRRRLGVLAVHLPATLGVLVAAFEWPVIATVALNAVLDCCSSHSTAGPQQSGAGAVAVA